MSASLEDAKNASREQQEVMKKRLEESEAAANAAVLEAQSVRRTLSLNLGIRISVGSHSLFGAAARMDIYFSSSTIATSN